MTTLAASALVTAALLRLLDFSLRAPPPTRRYSTNAS
jgi:hypothetical protein